MAKILTQHQEVGDALIALPLKVVLRHPQNVVAEFVHEDCRFLGNIEHFDESFVGVPTVVMRNPVEADSFSFQDVPCVQC